MESGMQAMLAAVNRGRAKAEARAERGSGSSGGSIGYMRWNAGEKKIIRFVHRGDHIITAKGYPPSILCNDGKKRSFLIDPKKGDFVQKYRHGNVGMECQFGTGELREPWVKEYTIGIAVERKELVSGEIVDLTVDVDVDGKKLPGRVFGIVQQLESNFWSHIAGIVNRWGDLCTYDLEVTREGNRDYKITPCPADDKLRDPDVVEREYGYGRPWKNDDPERFKYCPRTVADWADYFTSEEWQAKWLAQDGSGAAPQQQAAYAVAGSFGGAGSAVTAPATDPWGSAPTANGYGEFAPQTTHNPETVAEGPGQTDWGGLRNRLEEKRGRLEEKFGAQPPAK